MNRTFKQANPPGGNLGDPVQNFSNNPFSFSSRSLTRDQNQSTIDLEEQPLTLWSENITLTSILYM